ncbi:hypothetical protein DCS_08255 [Drechmeria coniospora]|uniref:Uncharacterized protein n=1 Tax=Drechmeria coniospora TaxID=98403 RepID=A0A151GGR8_DRECN|nr:hypothetical protein DCS_08255 [Drechmeria coniospora]KYK56285.1 hypothetical protein DCS_08255 [Drechmeria coniospora]
MASTVGALLAQDPTNSVQNTGYTSSTNKAWTEGYHPIKNMTVHTKACGDGLTYANFETAFLPLYDDDRVRMGTAAFPPNGRSWRMGSEADVELWFHTEISNVVLAAWNHHPTVVQTSHSKPPSEKNMPEEVDATYSFKSNQHRVALVIGEMKRNLVDADKWQCGRIPSSGPQDRLSRELRGYVRFHASTGVKPTPIRYAHKYECPQVFCFDGDTLLLLQFRANSRAELKHERCPVDCWVLPRENSGTPLRYALYRLLAQGFRRFQGGVALDGFSSDLRQFYNGRPLWTLGDVATSQHPNGYARSVHVATGAFMWTHPSGTDPIWETGSIWG